MKAKKRPATIKPTPTGMLEKEGSIMDLIPACSKTSSGLFWKCVLKASIFSIYALGLARISLALEERKSKASLVLSFKSSVALAISSVLVGLEPEPEPEPEGTLAQDTTNITIRITLKHNKIRTQAKKNGE